MAVVLRQFAFVAAPAILVLGVLNALPQFLGGDPLTVLRYATVEEAEARLGVPLQKPVALVRAGHWPPDRIRFAAVGSGWTAFDLPSRGGRDAAPFVLCQTVSPTGGTTRPGSRDGALGASDDDWQVPAALLSPGQVLQENDVWTSGLRLHVQRLLLDDGRIVHELWWRAGNRRVMLRAAVSADTLLRMAPALVGQVK